MNENENNILILENKTDGNTIHIGLEDNERKWIILGFDQNLTNDFKNKIIELFNEGYKCICIDSPANYEGYARGWSQDTNSFISGFSCS